MVMAMRPHNIRNPVSVDDPCYRCGGRYKILHADGDDISQWAEWGVTLVVKCRNCGILSAATRQVAPLQSLAA
jgi:2-keto-3-deoxy-L-rhamnonate aldolase RhmA